ncbi:sigma-70 family RNA polymerase sigma factor [Pedobacter sp. MC2016-05]|jgi:RNA polymerase sigma-70 factor (ECF subfamily)|uniref:RNA polymerase sigma factor n=1 Tax=unclassified Pedobacter TaxID=2628915 RepID=UPI0007037B58|nr:MULTISPECIES: sigma-70 family RNA polymerase sigma factor [unclassified Pedobacter]KQN35045.1 RNA polymerase subunit sigma [Pedobacter sp. Leaf41]MCX2476197.1 sigma-70 family RNA polymerase sigma factor [Pedobacter sp. MC2016-05]RZL53929.1 MAG: sigma-70 family RNA polymerase sigma factor [Pedobacter sp.]
MDQIEFSHNADRHATSLYSHAIRFTKDEDEAKDLVQDTLMKGIRFCHNFDEGTNIKGWLYVIMRNTFINNYRKDQKRNELITTEEDISSAHLLKSASKNASEGKFIMGDIQKALASIPQNYSIPFQRYFEGYKYHEIAEELGIPIGTVKTHIHQARIELKKYLKNYKGSYGI